MGHGTLAVLPQEVDDAPVAEDVAAGGQGRLVLSGPLADGALPGNPARFSAVLLFFIHGSDRWVVWNLKVWGSHGAAACRVPGVLALPVHPANRTQDLVFGGLNNSGLHWVFSGL